MTPNLNVNIPGSSPTTPPAGGLFAGGPNANTLGALVSQHRLLELSRFGLRGYDLAQHMLSQQGAVSKLLGKLTFSQGHRISRCVFSLCNVCREKTSKSNITMLNSQAEC
jgi:hypothetical protein